MKLDASKWDGRRVLVTGHTGFKGAWLAALLSDLGADVSGLARAAVAGGAYEGLEIGAQMRSFEHELADRAAISDVFQLTQPQTVFHLAAQALVAEGYADPVGTYETNVGGTANVLDAVRSCQSVTEVVVVTSDKVYSNDGSGRPFKESDRLGGHDPYSSSKAACELLCASWRQSFFIGGPIRLATARAGNVIGGGDVAPHRIVPDVIRAIEQGVAVELRHPSNVRPWQFVLEPLVGYVLYAQAIMEPNGQVPSALNFGPIAGNERTVEEIVEMFFSAVGEGKWVQAEEAPGAEAHTLSLDSSLAANELGWSGLLDLESAVEWTAEWFLAERSGGDCARVGRNQIRRYRELMGT